MLFNVRYSLSLKKSSVSTRLLTDILQFFDAQKVREKHEDELQQISTNSTKLQKIIKNLILRTFKIKAILSCLKHKNGQFRN